MPRFFDSEIRPPRGGWSYPIQGELVTKYSESEIKEAIKRTQLNNGSYTDDERIDRELWAYYCSREPERCGASKARAGAEDQTAMAKVASREVTPAIQGPPIWTFLNTLAVQWTPGLHDYFLTTCDAIIVILECPDCRREWRRLLQEYPPVNLSSRVSVCQWVNKVHNEVNRRTSKAEYPYTRMMLDFGAPAPTT